MSEKTGGDGDEPKVKWAAEACAFLSLFSKLRNRLSGLLMLLLGWALFARLFLPLTEPTSSSTQVAPAPTTHAGGQASAWLSIQLASHAAEIVVAGAAVIVLYWVIVSGIWKIPYLCFTRILYPIASVTVLIGTLIIALFLYPVSLVTLPLDFARFNYWLKRRYPNLTAEQTKLAEPELKRTFDKELKTNPAGAKTFEEWKKHKGTEWIAKEEERIAFSILWN